MNILLACGGGMSSSILAEALSKEAQNNGVTWEVNESSIDRVEDDLQEKDYQIVLLAPQVSFRKKYIAGLAEEKGAKLVLIPMTMYTPAKAKELFQLVNKEADHELWYNFRENGSGGQQPLFNRNPGRDGCNYSRFNYWFVLYNFIEFNNRCLESIYSTLCIHVVNSNVLFHQFDGGLLCILDYF